MISNEAVEAAVREVDRFVYKPPADELPSVEGHKNALMRAVLEAAAPYMLPAPEGASEAEKRAIALVDATRRFIAAEKEHARLSKVEVQKGAHPGALTTRDEVDLCHAVLVEFTLADCDIARSFLSALSSERERAERAEARAANLQMQAESWAMEARGHKSTVHEAYQAVTGATGEPGNWHGAEPIKAALAVAEARAQDAEAKVKEVAEFVIKFLERQVPITVTRLRSSGINRIFAENVMSEYLAQAQSFRAALRWTEEASQGEGE